MESNIDEAVRAKSIADGKMERKDYSGSKKYALKAQNMYPDLEGISQLLTTIDVYVSAENKISGEVDWYGVLGVAPSVDDESLRKQYRKLALELHPDKNKSVGADGAFRLLSEAWSLLSDKAKRSAYNQRRGSKGFQQNLKTHTGGPSAPPGANGFHSVSSRSASAPKAHRNIAPKAVASQRNDTFWTICHRCKIHYEYLNVYLNNTLLCPNCREPFVAKETAPPFSHPMPSNSVTDRYHQGSSARTSSGNLRPGSNAARPVPTGRSASSNSLESSVARASMGNKFGSCSSGLTRGGSEARQVNGFPGNFRKPKSFTELTPHELHKILVEKGQNEIQKKLNEWQPKTAAKAASIKKEKVKAAYQHDMNGIDELSISKRSDVAKSFYDNASNDVEEGNPVATSMDVPDPEFYDFDLDRSENSFGDNEVWAAYDNDDGMPRFYALIHKVISRKPFKIKLSWLNSKTNSEFGSIDWVGSGFYKTCGEFRIGKYEMNNSINSFSYKVKWFKGPRGTVHIYPKKGDAWALYRNWSPDWNEHTPDEVVHKYEMFLVLNDYDEEQGISVAPLMKIDGFRTVFYPLMDPVKIKRIPKEEMFRFSHQVPSYLLTDEEVKNAPENCQELDPASTPGELLQVATEDAGPVGNNNGDAMDVDKQSPAQVG